MPVQIVAMFFCLCLLCGCQNDNVKNSAPPAPVHVAVATGGSITRTLNAVGNVEASATVDIIPRVSGQITAVHFVEGDDVKEGQPLLEIDPRPYAAALAEKKANLARSEAQLAKAERDRRRYGQLVGNGYVSREAFEQAATDAAALRATVQADRAAVDMAALDLAYCNIKAPLSGRIGALKMQKGAMIKASDTAPIVTIDAITPCRVIFSVPEPHLPAIQERLRSGALGLTAIPHGGQPEQGQVTLMDNNVDSRTGSIRLRGEFANESRNLWPGQFVEVKLPLGEIEEALLVPAPAVQTGREESYVYVINPDNRADYRKVRVVFEGAGQSAVAGDLHPGEKVVADGHVRLAPGVSVRILE